jgi:hypothetical protein
MDFSERLTIATDTKHCSRCRLGPDSPLSFDLRGTKEPLVGSDITSDAAEWQASRLDSTCSYRPMENTTSQGQTDNCL